MRLDPCDAVRDALERLFLLIFFFTKLFQCWNLLLWSLSGLCYVKFLRYCCAWCALKQAIKPQFVQNLFLSQGWAVRWKCSKSFRPRPNAFTWYYPGQQLPTSQIIFFWIVWDTGTFQNHKADKDGRGEGSSAGAGGGLWVLQGWGWWQEGGAGGNRQAPRWVKFFLIINFSAFEKPLTCVFQPWLEASWGQGAWLTWPGSSRTGPRTWRSQSTSSTPGCTHRWQSSVSRTQVYLPFYAV